MLTINNTVEGYLKDVEIKGNTWQDSENLADIRSVGTKVEGQELYEIPVLSRGKNLFNKDDILFNIAINSNNGAADTSANYHATNFIPIKPDTPYIRSLGSGIYYYDKDYKYISFLSHGVNSPSNAKYCRLQLTIGWDVNTFQFEEGTQATPYEPYQEDKLTILSPTPLEKVGDVADRIVCKDGVWGVEKNIGEVVLNDEENWSYRHSNDAFYFYQVKLPFNTKNQYDNKLITNKYIAEVDWGKQYEYCFVNEYNGLVVSSSISTLNEFKDSLKAIPLQVYYQTAQPQFIPLPNSQQIKLRTFANKTHISFDTEIQPTLKAQVPKSLGATVNTHTSQIDNLNKELDRVKKLEESTVSTVTSSKAFTTIAETTGGYFEDVKLEGKTLVNLCTHKEPTLIDATKRINHSMDFKPNTTYTIIFTSDKIANGIEFSFRDTTGSSYYTEKFKTTVNAGLNIIKINILPNISSIVGSTFYIAKRGEDECTLSNIVLLEGDHTDKDISFFEGLKSVGQDTDEISVSSASEDYLGLEQGSMYTTTGEFAESETRVRSALIPYNSRTDINIDFSKFKVIFFEYDYSRNFIYSDGGWKKSNRTLSDQCKYYRVLIAKLDNSKITVDEVKDEKSDKKQILYYNSTIQTWEKPVLREWDSIEKHSDGKYYYHKRSEEVVLNGSENWSLIENLTRDNTLFYHLGSNVGKNGIEIICDKFIHYSQADIVDYECFRYHNGFQIRINKSKLSTQDVEGFKAWLQANPVTVAYELAQEEVYECTNLDLITYSRETNLIVNSGAIQPKLELKVLSNVSNVVRLLQEKVSILENNTSSYIVTQNRLQLASTYAADSVTFKVDYASAFDNRSVDGYNPDLYNLILSNILVGKDNYDYDKMFSIILDYASWDQISWEQFDELVLLMDIQHNPPIEIPEEDYTEEEIPEI